MSRHIPGIKESHWQEQVIGLARFYGWRVAHFGTAMTKRGNYVTPVRADGKGFPDLVLVKVGLPVIFAELKTDKGRLSDSQKIWLEVLDGALDVEVYVWRPRDYDLVEATLQRRASGEEAVAA